MRQTATTLTALAAVALLVSAAEARGPSHPKAGHASVTLVKHGGSHGGSHGSRGFQGSHGRRGNVLGLLQQLWERKELPERVRILACGPDPMLAAVEALARERELECWLSLETLMGCGVGICNGCPVPTRRDGPLGAWSNAKCCVEGPVFPLEALALD